MKLHNLNVKFNHNPIEKSTTCKILTEKNQYYGMACCGKKDSFNKATGRKLSLLRAMQNLGLSRVERFQEWDAYRCMTSKPRWNPTILNSRIIKKMEKNRKKQLKLTHL